MVCAFDKKVIVDIEELRNSPRLTGAHIFKRLMCIEESEFKSESLNTNLFKDFDISNKNWCSFINFLRSGRIEYDIAANNIINKEDRLSYQKLFIQELDEQCNSGIFLKFGPFPAFDAYVSETIDNQQNLLINTKNEDANNPMLPEKDAYQIYDWAVSHVNVNRMEELINNGWTVTTNVENTSNVFYLRRQKINDPPGIIQS